VPLPTARGEDDRSAASGMRDLDGYFDSDDVAATTGELSRVG
jgi:hypothetical protein